MGRQLELQLLEVPNHMIVMVHDLKILENAHRGSLEFV
jgi:hypothetical protein